MKLNFKYFYYGLIISCFSTTLLGREAFLISFNEYEKKAKRIERILMLRFSIPKELIHIQKVKTPCKKIDKAIIQICINENKEMKFPYINRKILNRSLKLLWKKNEKFK